MTALINLYLRLAYTVEHRLGPILMPTLARFLFAAIFALYYWNAAMTKTGPGMEGLWMPSAGAFAQIFPAAAEAAGYDVTAADTFQKTVILAATWAELVLPVLVIIGLFTRFAALGMAVFVVVQSATDVLGHHASAGTVGAWFDAAPDSAIFDQRALWIMLLLVLVFRGAGPVSADSLIKRRLRIY